MFLHVVEEACGLFIRHCTSEAAEETVRTWGSALVWEGKRPRQHYSSCPEAKWKINHRWPPLLLLKWFSPGLLLEDSQGFEVQIRWGRVNPFRTSC